MKIRSRAAVLITLLILAPSVAFAQASITGVVRDTSGGVLPGRDGRGIEPGAHREGAVGDD